MKKLYLALMFILNITAIHAQSAGDIDPTFHIGRSLSVSGIIASTVTQPDNKIIAVGSFTFYDDKIVNNIVRLNPDGTIDNTFNLGTGFDGNVESMAIQADGKILMGGNFNSYNGTPAKYLIRLNSDGTIDPTFNQGGTGFQDYFRFHLFSIIVQPDGEILLAGRLSSYNGAAVANVMRLNADGTLDSSFKPEVPANIFLNPIAIDKNGKILISGSFITATDNLVRLNTDGTPDTTFKLVGITQSLSINSIGLQSDGKIILTGGFTAFGTVPVKGIVRLNQNGMVDNTFDSLAGLNTNTTAIAIAPDDKIIVAGNHNLLNSPQISQAVRLNKDGTIDPSFSSNLLTGIGVDENIRTINILPDGKILFGGLFTRLSGKIISSLAKVDSTGTIDPTYNVKNALFTIPGYSIYTLAQQQDGKIIITGNFNYYFNTLSSRIARLNQDGNIDSTFQTQFVDEDTFDSMTIQSDGKIILGGLIYFNSEGKAQYLVRLNPNGSIDNTFNLGTGFGSFVKSLCLQPDGKILVGGGFTSFNGTNTKSIIRLNPNGTLDSSFNPSTSDNWITAIAVQTDGKILAGGNSFKRLNPDGTSDTAFNANVGSGFTTQGTPGIQNIIIQPDGKILVFGNFSAYNGTATPGFIRLNSDGTIDTTFSTAIGITNTIKYMALQSNGKIVALATLSNGSTKVLRLNSNGTLDISFNGGVLDSYSTSLLVQKDQKILIGGAFGKYNDIVCQGLVRLMGDSSLSVEDYTDTEGTFVVYPNPTNSQLNIQPSDLSFDRIIVTDLLGKSVLKVENSSNINVENLASGMYILTVYSSGATWRAKFLKQ